MSKNTRWVKQAKSLYFWSFVGWLAVTALLLVKLLSDLLSAEIEILIQRLSNPMYSFYLMLMAGPGIIYFYVQSKKMDASKLEDAQSIFERIMNLYRPTGITATIGAVLGLLPFLVNFFGIFSNLSNLWINVELIFPWISLYGFVTTYIISLVLNKARKNQ